VTIYALPKARNETRVRRWLIAALVVMSLIAFLLVCTRRDDRLRCVARCCVGYWPLSSLSGNFLASEMLMKKSRRHRESIRSRLIRPASASMGRFWSKFIPWNDVTRVEEPENGRGLYVRTHRRLFWYLIPRRTERYEEMRGELAAAGVPIVQASAPWNWAILFALFYCGSLLCDLLTQDRRILVCNFSLAVMLGIGGALVANRGMGDRRFRILGMVGSCVPAVMSMVSLLWPIWLK
jgi:hypothetical protein